MRQNKIFNYRPYHVPNTRRIHSSFLLRILIVAVILLSTHTSHAHTLTRTHTPTHSPYDNGDIDPARSDYAGLLVLGDIACNVGRARPSCRHRRVKLGAEYCVQPSLNQRNQSTRVWINITKILEMRVFLSLPLHPSGACPQIRTPTRMHTFHTPYLVYCHGASTILFPSALAVAAFLSEARVRTRIDHVISIVWLQNACLHHQKVPRIGSNDNKKHTNR